VLLAISALCLVLHFSPTDADREWQRLDETVQQAIDRGELPGAVVLVLHDGKVVYRKAHGLRSKQPSAEPMTVDTVFDLASLTKPVATATSIMLLAERGKLRVADRVSQHWPEFGRHGKDRITVAQLLLHTGGLIADNPETDYRDDKGEALERICDLKLAAEPGARFTYSDVGYIVLGEAVERLAGCPLDEFARKNIFVPLGMRDTAFRPDDSLKKRCAPTEQREGRWMIGEVHDPRAYRLGGVAGHAGLFSTADDLAIYARMLLGCGKPILGENPCWP
jgi:CubicO group peptidase (beta-lactamase class C family)